MNYYHKWVCISLCLCSPCFAGVTYFSCSTNKGDVILEEQGGRLFYKFMNKAGGAFFYLSKDNDFNGFSYNHYARFQTYYFNVSFLKDKYKYSVFSYFEAGKYTQGVNVVNIDSKQESSFPCQTVAVDHLNDLSGKLACDTDSALGCG